MTNVLVGGKRRQEVLEAHLQRAKETPAVSKPIEHHLPPFHMHYSQLEWQLKGEKPYSTHEFHFIEACQAIHTWGYERPPLPAELFSLLIDHIEGNTTEGWIHAIANAIEGRSEWFDMVVRAKNGILSTHAIPDISRDAHYNLYMSKCKAGETWVIGKDQPGTKYIPLEQPVPLEVIASVCPTLITYLYSRPLEKLPAIAKKATITLPPDDVLFALYRTPSENPFSMSAKPKYSVHARGVRAKGNGGDR